MQVPYNQTFKDQNARLIPAGKKKAIISAVNVNQRQVDIYFINNPTTVIKGVPVSSNVNLTSASVGLVCKVDVFDETNQKDMIVAYLYGAATGYTGSFTVITGISIDFTGKTFSTTSKVLTIVNGVVVTAV